MSRLSKNVLRRLVVLMSVGLLSFALFAACGEGEDEAENQNGGDEYADVDDTEMMAQVLTDAFCEAVWDCHADSREAASMGTTYGRFHSVDDCKDHAELFVDETGTAELDATFDSGRASVDRSAASTCKNALYDGLCEHGFNEEALAPCLEEFLVGEVEEGGHCVDDTECAGDLWCDSLEDECYGTCGEAESFECNGEVCDDGEYCHYDWEEETESCEPHGEQGEACDGGFQCEYSLDCIEGSCEPIEIAAEGEECGGYGAPYCEPGLGCDGEPFSDSGTCVEIGDEGDECYSDEACHAAYFCDRDDPEEPGECASPRAAGEPCQTWSHCQSGECEFEDPEDEEGTCMGVEDAMCVHPDDE